MSRMLSLDIVPPHLSDEEALWQIVGRSEHESLDFKLRPDGLPETIAAMAMTSGGLVLLGVADDRSIRGCALDQETRDRITEAAHQCGVAVDVKEVALPHARITAVGVPEITQRIVTTPNGRLLRRYGSHSKPLTGDAMARFVMARLNHASEEETIADPRVFERLEPQWINMALRKEGRAAVRAGGIPRALVDLGLAVVDGDGAIRATKAAVLIFGKDPREYVPGACVQLVRRLGAGPGPGTTSLREEIYGPLPSVVDRAIALIEENTRRYEGVIRTHREGLPEYPQVALREAVANAVAHRDYGLSGATVDITIWDDRIEIRSPGPLPGHITVDNIRDEHFSRNRKIMQLLKVLDLVEEYGEGVDRMIRAMEQRLMDPPSFQAGTASVSVVFRNHSLLSPDEQLWFSLLGHLDLSSEERHLLAILKRDRWTTPRRLRALMPNSDVDGLIQAALTKGLLWRVGQRGGTRYVPSFEIAVRAGDIHVGNGNSVSRPPSLELRSRQRQLLLDEVRARGALSVSDAARVLPKEPPSVARSLLDDLVRAGELQVTGRTRGRRYIAVEG